MRSRSWKPHIPAGRRNGLEGQEGLVSLPDPLRSLQRRAREGNYPPLSPISFRNPKETCQTEGEKDLRSIQAAGSPIPSSHPTSTKPEHCDCPCTPTLLQPGGAAASWFPTRMGGFCSQRGIVGSCFPGDEAKPYPGRQRGASNFHLQWWPAAAAAGSSDPPSPTS